MTTTFLSILTTLLLAQLVSPLENDFCTDPYFEQEWLGKSTTFTLPQIHALQEAGWSALLSSNKPTRAWGVCPCHNAAFTSDDEQWDGIPTQGMQEIRSECYFSLPQCAPYFQTGNCPGASPLSSHCLADASPWTGLLVAPLCVSSSQGASISKIPQSSGNTRGQPSYWCCSEFLCLWFLGG